MFIHIGGTAMVRLSDIIGIFDVSTAESPDTKNYLDLARHANSMETVEVGEVKSLIITNKRVYYSPISSLTLKKRASMSFYTKSKGPT